MLHVKISKCLQKHFLAFYLSRSTTSRQVLFPTIRSGLNFFKKAEIDFFDQYQGCLFPKICHFEWIHFSQSYIFCRSQFLSMFLIPKFLMIGHKSPKRKSHLPPATILVAMSIKNSKKNCYLVVNLFDPVLMLLLHGYRLYAKTGLTFNQI